MSPRQQYWPRYGIGQRWLDADPPPSAEQLRWLADNGHAEEAAAMRARGAGYREFAAFTYVLRQEAFRQARREAGKL